MTLTDIKNYLMLNGSATLAELALNFDADRSQVESMLEHWARKGRVVAVHPKSCSSSCCGGCSPHGGVRYRWSRGEP